MKLSFVTKILSFNPTLLMNQSLRTRKLLKNKDVLRMLRVAHLYGELKQTSSFTDPVQSGNYTFEKVIQELEK
ncbi:MAG: hypothetical protein D4R64_13220 [Porphyromonadaceae bacterium]|nr:MAG: hypothetical protein D4R64_13220 [Porphyromonadaceae bacterium]